MKRLLLLPALLLGLSFACDQPYEEVAGYKIGCTYQEEGFEKSVDREDGNVVYYFGEREIGPFDNVNITTLNGDIAIVNMYIDPSYFLDNKIVLDLSKSMEERWGAFHVGEYGIYENNSPKSNTLGFVSIYKPDRSIDEKLFSVSYVSKKYLEYKKAKEKAELEKKQADLAEKEKLRRETYSDF